MKQSSHYPFQICIQKKHICYRLGLANLDAAYTNIGQAWEHDSVTGSLAGMNAVEEYIDFEQREGREREKYEETPKNRIYTYLRIKPNKYPYRYQDK